MTQGTKERAGTRDETMPAGSWQFRPKPLIVALYLVFGISMLLLGQWQMSRASEKIELLELSERARQATAVPLLQLHPLIAGSEGDLTDAANAEAQQKYPRVSLRGRVRTDTQFLWDNRIHKGQAGYEVIVPVELDDGRLALVNRGWVPLGLSRASLPDVADSPVSVDLEGILTYPSKGFASGDALSQIRNQWPRVIQYMDYNAIQNELDALLIAGLVQSVSILPDNTVAPGKSSIEGKAAEPFVYTDNWKAAANGPEKHYGYAFQWFAMFIALSVLFIWLNLSRNLQNQPI